MATLFPIEEIPCIKSVQVRDPGGRFTTKKMKQEFDRLRNQIVTLIRQRQSVYRQLRQKDELIAELTIQIKKLKNENH